MTRTFEKKQENVTFELLPGEHRSYTYANGDVLTFECSLDYGDNRIKLTRYLTLADGSAKYHPATRDESDHFTSYNPATDMYDLRGSFQILGNRKVEINILPEPIPLTFEQVQQEGLRQFLSEL